MCTAISYQQPYHLFGRTLDVEASYGEMAVVTPRNFCLRFRHEAPLLTHPAMMGIACVRGNTPLYFDAINEKGLSIAALNFPGNAVYHQPRATGHNITSFELIPWILGQCETLSAAIALLRDTNITSDSFSPELPATPLHWIVADKSGAVTVESVSAGLEIYENRFGVLTNNPPFHYHVTHLSDFMWLDARPPQNNLCHTAELARYSQGMGAMGLPGDFSSSSRFVRAVFAQNHLAKKGAGTQAVGQFFHMMDTVTVPLGCVKNEDGKNVFTVYTSCADTDSFTYYFTTYHCRRVRALHLDGAPLAADTLLTFSMDEDEDIQHLTV
ncbi:MAG: choloylglycine hydrolase family protein [Ruminococcaceae bacterium]|nr:choloylglycine hydrolase family protein [Oscillospiraceae bacterium]